MSLSHNHNDMEAAPRANDEIQAAPYVDTNNYNSEKNQVEHVDLKTEANFRADAIEAENAEHAMTVMQAAKAYPMACFWAFIMSFTIVSRPLGLPTCSDSRSWSLIVSSSLETSSRCQPFKIATVCQTAREGWLSRPNGNRRYRWLGS